MAKKLFPGNAKKASSRAGRGNSAAGNSSGGKQMDRDDATGGLAGMTGDRASPQGGGMSMKDKIVADRPAGTRPMTDKRGATDGLGAGRGGLAVHPSASALGVDDYQPRHTTRDR